MNEWCSGVVDVVKMNSVSGTTVPVEERQRETYTGVLVSPTDRPTISAMTASRPNRAKAISAYFWWSIETKWFYHVSGA